MCQDIALFDLSDEASLEAEIASAIEWDEEFPHGECRECGAPLEDNGECPECIQAALEEAAMHAWFDALSDADQCRMFIEPGRYI